MKNLATLLFIICLSYVQISAQCDMPYPPSNICDDAVPMCISDLDGYCSTLPDTAGLPAPVLLCPSSGVSNNINWIAFIADNTDLEFTITPSNCTPQGGFNGMQAGIYDNCDLSAPGTTTLACMADCSVSVFTMNAENLVIGNTYFLFVDGCAGVICEYTVAVTGTGTGIPPEQVIGEYCVDEGFYFYSGNGMDYSEGNYLITIPGASVSGCDSLVNLTVIENEATESAIVASICEGSSYSVCGEPFFSTGQYLVDCSPNVNGCDSTIILDLTVNPTYEVNIVEEGCGGDMLFVCGQWCAAGTNYSLNCGPSTQFGCDSIVNLTYTDNSSDTTYLDLTLCGGSSFDFCGVNYNTSGLFTADCGPNMVGCDSITILDLTFYPANSSVLSETLCEGDFVIVNGTIYNSSNPNGIEVLANVDVNGCDSTIVVDLTFAPADVPFISNIQIQDETCIGANGSICFDVICGAEPYTYEWSIGSMDMCLTDLVGGSYTVVVTDALGITAEEFFTIGSSAPVITFNPTIIDASCNGASDGCVQLTDVIGGCEPYSFQWNNANTNQWNCNIPAGNTSVTITDCTGCTSEFNFTVNEPAPITITLANNPMVSCNGGNDGCIELVDMPGNTYLWSTGAEEAEICGLSAGFYTVTVTDSNGCTNESTFEVTEPDPIVITLENNPSLLCNGDSDACIEILASGGQAPYSEQWSGGLGGGVSVCGLSAGIYEVTVTDANNCTSVNAFEVIDPSPLSLVAEDIQCATPGQNDGSITLDANIGGTGGFTFQWSHGPLTMNVDNLSEGTYSVTVTDINNCSAAATFETNLTPDIDDAFICNGGTHQFNVDVPTAVGISWSPAIGLSCTDCYDPVASPSATTVYTVVIETADGCFVTSDVTVNVEEQPIIDVVGPLMLCEGGDFIGCPSIIVGNDPVSWEWTLPDGSIVTDECLEIIGLDSDDTGLYELTITFAGGCIASTDFTMLVESVIFTISDDVTACIDVGVTLELAGPNVAAVTWTPADFLTCTNCFTSIASPLETTTYTALVVDVFGCTAEAQVTVTIDQTCVWPGDTDTNKVVNNFDILNIGLAYDSTGPLRPGANLMWLGQEGPDWMQTAPNGSNYKHIDTDGNGLIDGNDTLAISQNWGSMHNLTGDDDQELMPDFPPSNGAPLTVPFYVKPDTLIEGQMISLPVILGESGNPAEDLYGIAFTLEYDTAVVVPGSVDMGFDQSWLGDNSDDLITIHRDFFTDNKVRIGMTRIDGTPMTGFGTLASFFITVEDDLLFAPGGDNNFTPAQNEAIFNITNVLAINHLGEEIEVIPMETTAEVVTTSTSTHNPDLAAYISIFPNPATDLLWVNTKDIKLTKIDLLNISGQKVSVVDAPAAQQKIDLSRLSVGTYFVKVYSEEGVYVERVVVF